eukprot:COSAG01_NODE_50682_length_361_cov_0.965649_1_plen_73_part_10
MLCRRAECAVGVLAWLNNSGVHTLSFCTYQLAEPGLKGSNWHPSLDHAAAMAQQPRQCLCHVPAIAAPERLGQ